MPFYGRDWRSPGDEWVKTSSGAWERAKISRLQLFEMLNYHTMLRQYRQELSGASLSSERRMQSESGTGESESRQNGLVQYMPHIVIKNTSTRENAMVTTLSDALVRLDMRVAIEDVRRFAYVCNILGILLRDKFHRLGGRTQLYVVDLLQCVCRRVCDYGNQVKMLRDLLTAFRTNLVEHKYEHVGSKQLWLKHEENLNNMAAALDALQLAPSEVCSSETIDIPTSQFRHVRGKRTSLISSTPGTEGGSPSSSPQLADLPSSCLLNIMSHLSSLEDLHNAAVAHPTLAQLTHDPHLWHSLIYQHFSAAQLRSVMTETRLPLNSPREGGRECLDDCNWPHLYKRLLRRFGDGHMFACQLNQCEVCAAVFWPVYGHPCSSAANDRTNIKIRPLSPEDFVKLFPL